MNTYDICSGKAWRGEYAFYSKYKVFCNSNDLKTNIDTFLINFGLSDVMRSINFKILYMYTNYISERIDNIMFWYNVDIIVRKWELIRFEHFHLFLQYFYTILCY